MTILKDKVLMLRRKFKFVTKDRFMYAQKGELRKTSNSIMCWLLIDSKNKGVFIFEFRFDRARKLSYKEWAKLWGSKIAVRRKKTHARVKGYKSLYAILSEDILPNISEKYRDTWKFVDLVGWSFNTKPFYFKK